MEQSVFYRASTEGLQLFNKGFFIKCRDISFFKQCFVNSYWQNNHVVRPAFTCDVNNSDEIDNR